MRPSSSPDGLLPGSCEAFVHGEPATALSHEASVPQAVPHAAPPQQLLRPTSRIWTWVPPTLEEAAPPGSEETPVTEGKELP